MLCVCIVGFFLVLRRGAGRAPAKPSLLSGPGPRVSRGKSVPRRDESEARESRVRRIGGGPKRDHAGSRENEMEGIGNSARGTLLAFVNR